MPPGDMTEVRLERAVDDLNKDTSTPISVKNAMVALLYGLDAVSSRWVKSSEENVERYNAFNQQIAQLVKKMDEGFTQLGHDQTAVGGKLGALETRVGAVETTLLKNVDTEVAALKEASKKDRERIDALAQTLGRWILAAKVLVGVVIGIPGVAVAAYGIYKLCELVSKAGGPGVLTGKP